MADLEYLVTAELSLSKQIDALESEKQKIRATLIEALPVGSHPIAGATVIVTQPHRWDAAGKKAFTKDYTPEEWPELYQYVPNVKAIDDELAPRVVRSYKTKGAKQIWISE